jgi:hypothetical protein
MAIMTQIAVIENDKASFTWDMYINSSENDFKRIWNERSNYN